MNLHMSIQKPMTKTSVKALCRLVELLKVSLLCEGAPYKMDRSCLAAHFIRRCLLSCIYAPTVSVRWGLVFFLIK